MDEGGHYYRRDGSPCYEVPTKAGGVRPINLRWDRHLLLVPSVTTVTQIIAKPQLVRWQIQQGILAALTLPREPGEPDEAYLARVMSDSKQQVTDAADEGTRIHDACECHYKGRVVPRKYRAVVEKVAEEVARLFPGVNDWVSEASFAHPSGFGGKVDLHSPSTGIVVDFKGKDGDFTETDAYGRPKRLAFDQHWQLGAYQHGLELPEAPCANVFFSRTHVAAKGHKWTVDEIREGKRVFGRALALWRELKRYDPRFTREAQAA